MSAAAPAAGTENLDPEDQMAAALDELRQERAAESTTAAPAPAPAPADAPAPSDGAAAAADGQSTDAGNAPSQATGQASAAPGAAPATDPAKLLEQTQQQLQHARSELGRVGALNRNLAEARAKLERLQQENATLKKAAPSPEQPLGEDAATKLAALAEKAKGFPELEGLVGAVQQALQAVDAKAATVAEQTAARMVEPLHDLRAEHNQRQQEQRAAAFEAAMQTFQTTYPNAVEVVRSPEFNAWIRTQPQPTQQAFYQGQDPGEAMVVMDAYDAALRRAGKAPIAQYPTQQTAAPAPAPAAERARANDARLKAAAGLPSRNSGNQGGLPPEDDFEANVAYFRDKRLAKAQRAA
ncbi:hypothetical protein [Acidovorax sp. A1169]|uniref:hypothetical protein n=1 Tax=Acidovorax sp. A1169 TaxID=3059524 RepID=UPI002737C50A|nr:hypothetical protein [Acidovorax sp. A1169]MDP4076251.1 hypothetical protein [Acidovorax sp. A1169]